MLGDDIRSVTKTARTIGMGSEGSNVIQSGSTTAIFFLPRDDRTPPAVSFTARHEAMR
jgi:hypothetical protein